MAYRKNSLNDHCFSYRRHAIIALMALVLSYAKEMEPET